MTQPTILTLSADFVNCGYREQNHAFQFLTWLEKNRTAGGRNEKIHKYFMEQNDGDDIKIKINPYTGYVYAAGENFGACLICDRPEEGPFISTPDGGIEGTCQEFMTNDGGIADAVVTADDKQHVTEILTACGFKVPAQLAMRRRHDTTEG